jgi:hypothetical protein
MRGTRIVISIGGALLVATAGASLPVAALAQERGRDKPPAQAEGGSGRDGRQARPREPEASRPREQPQAPRQREPQLKRRKP